MVHAQAHHIGNWNVLLTFAHQNNLMIKPGEKDKEETHLFLNGALGGRLSVPDDKYDDFLRAVMFASIRDDAYVYLIERQTRPIFRLFLEIDFESLDTPLSLDQVIADVMPPFIRVVDAAYPDFEPAQRRAVVCMAEPKVVKQISNPDGTLRDVMKTGIHVYFSGIAIDGLNAWKMRAWFLHELTMSANVPKPFNGWETAIDPCVFDANGLRMIWSRKAAKCPECKGKSHQILLEERKERKMQKAGGVRAGSTKQEIIKVGLFSLSYLEPLRLSWALANRILSAWTSSRATLARTKASWIKVARITPRRL